MKTSLPSSKPSARLFPIGLAICLLIGPSTPALAIVGYVNVPMTNGYNFVVNPLNVSSNNSITNVIPVSSGLPVGTRVWLWNVTNQLFDPPSTFANSNAGWTLNLSLPPGRGFVLHTITTYTNTFVGEVLVGTNSNFIAGSNKLSLVGCKIPVGGELSSQPFNFPAGEGDLVSVYPTLNQRYLDGYTFFSGYGWFDPRTVVSTNGPNITVGKSFFVRRRGADTNWVQILNPLVVSRLSTGGGSSSPPPDIVGLTIQDGVATLRLSETKRPYNVQFSTDQVSWTTIATNQIGGTWAGPCPSPTAGFFQLVSP